MSRVKLPRLSGMRRLHRVLAPNGPGSNLTVADGVPHPVLRVRAQLERSGQTLLIAAKIMSSWQVELRG